MNMKMKYNIYTYEVQYLDTLGLPCPKDWPLPLLDDPDHLPLADKVKEHPHSLEEEKHFIILFKVDNIADSRLTILDKSD